MTPLELAQLEQGSELWIQARVGLVTASRCADVIAMTKKGEGADRRNYRTELICERLTGIPYPQYVTKDMEWGREQEPFARAAYELRYDVLVETVGFVPHPTITNFGCSPDGYSGDKGMLQIKCPTIGTHLAYLMAGVVPVEHIPQMLGELACHPEREWSDFVSFHPAFPEHLQLFVRRFERNDKLIATLESEVQHFNYELEETLAALPAKPQGIVIAMDAPNADEMEF